MVEKKKGCIAWVKAHKKEISIAGISIGTIIAITLGIKNRDTLLKMWEIIKTVIRLDHLSTPITTKNQDAITALETGILSKIQATETEKIIRVPFDVSGHIRNLHPGWNASADKLAEAEALGITLLRGQTLVDAYTKARCSQE